MLRCQSMCSAAVAWQRRGALRVSQCFFSRTRVSLLEQDPAELEREKSLRGKMEAKFGSMRFPTMDNHTYGSTMGADGQYGWKKEGGAGPVPPRGFPSFGGRVNGSGGVDWLMLLTGLGLVYFSTKLMFGSFNFKVDDVNMPLWLASSETQAKYLIFTVQYDAETRQRIKEEFHAVRQSYPLIDFFSWLESRHPESGHGRRYQREVATGIMIGALGNTNRMSLTYLARNVSTSIAKTGGDPCTRLDEFLDGVAFGGGNPMGGGGRGPYGGSSFGGNPFGAYQSGGQYGMPNGIPQNPLNPTSFPTPPPLEGTKDVTMNDVLSNTSNDAGNSSNHGSVPFSTNTNPSA